MITTANQGWPVAVGGDPAKQYPAAVDAPFKTDLDTKITALLAGNPYGVISYQPGAAGNNIRLVATAGASAARGISHDGSGRLTITKTGVYGVTAGIVNSTGSITWMRAVAKTDSGNVSLAGSIGPGTGVGSTSSVSGVLVVAAAPPQSIGLWVECSAAIQVSNAFLALVRFGDL